MGHISVPRDRGEKQKHGGAGDSGAGTSRGCRMGSGLTSQTQKPRPQCDREEKKAELTPYVPQSPEFSVISLVPNVRGQALGDGHVDTLRVPGVGRNPEQSKWVLPLQGEV